MGKSKKAKAVAAIKPLIAEGRGYVYICQFLTESYDVSERTAARYLAEAREEMQEGARLVAPFAFGEVVGQLNMLLREAIKRGDLRIVLDCIKEKAKLYDLYPAQRHEHSWKHELIGLVNSGNATVDEVAAEFGDELAAELFGHVATA